MRGLSRFSLFAAAQRLRQHRPGRAQLRKLRLDPAPRRLHRPTRPGVLPPQPDEGGLPATRLRQRPCAERHPPQPATSPAPIPPCERSRTFRRSFASSDRCNAYRSRPVSSDTDRNRSCWPRGPGGPRGGRKNRRAGGRYAGTPDAGRRTPGNRSVNPVWTWERASGRCRCRRPARVDVPVCREGPQTGSARCSRRCLPDCRNAGYREDRTVTTPDAGTDVDLSSAILTLW